MAEFDHQAVTLGLQQGHTQAWTALYDQYSGGLWRYVSRLLGNQASATGDVVQEVFLAAAQSARQFDPARGTLWSWLLGIAHKQVANHWRQTARSVRVKTLAEQGAWDIGRWLDLELPETRMERRELCELVRGLLSDLPGDYTALLLGKYLDGQSLEELAAAWQTTVEATKSKLARARREFRACFDRATANHGPHAVISVTAVPLPE
ncbi:MAG: sigma-70 family RNA polymerase sigma factor [Pirellulales bacterium]|nr:sigma-70 family RNA polymerase sigma factor [Pirellulales bacterium]